MAPLPDLTQTIAAPATPPGSGAIGVVRLSGPAAIKTALTFLKAPKTPGFPAPRAAYRLDAADGRETVDEVVAVFYRAPASYTGEDMAEIFCHGSPFIMRRLLALACKRGAREAAPGEFTLRAFANGKLDLARAEAVNELILAENSAAHRAAITQIKGHLSDRISALREKALSLLAELEVRLDDSYGDIAPLELKGFRARAAALSGEIGALAAGFEKGRYVSAGARVVIAGEPNSGKSSLLNALAGYPRAIVSPKAGTTRDTVEEKLPLGGFSFILTDTAGLNAGSRDRLELEGGRRTLEALSRADIAILALDGARKVPGSGEARTVKAVEEALPEGASLLRVVTKADLRRRKRKRGETSVSAKTGAGVAALKAALLAFTEGWTTEEASGIVTSARHFSALTRAGGEAAELTRLLSSRAPRLELAAEKLRACLNELAAILGETTPEDVLSDIFSRFCVGK